MTSLQSSLDLLSKDPNTAYWFCSAVAQSFATLTALAGIFAVYRLQSIQRDLRDIVEAMRERMLTVRRMMSPPLPDGPQVSYGEFGQRKTVELYNKQYAPFLKRSVDDPASSYHEPAVFLSGAEFEYKHLSGRARGISKLAFLAMLLDGIVTALALEHILYVPGLDSISESWILVALAFAGFIALATTTYACIYLLDVLS